MRGDGRKKEAKGATSDPRERVPRSVKKALTRSGRTPLTNAISCRGCGCGTGSFFPLRALFYIACAVSSFKHGA